MVTKLLLVTLCAGVSSLWQARASNITYTLHLGGVDGGIANQISNSMAEAVGLYNQHGDFTKHLNVYYSSGVPTAQANYDGVITFGGSRNTRVALHEIAHTLGIGTHSGYWNLMTGGTWDGAVANDVLSGFDGPNSVMNGDSTHMWPYGLNYDNEDGATNRVRHIQIVEAMRCDMGIGPCPGGGSGIAGNNRKIENRASGKVMDAFGNSNGANVIIYSDYGTPNQRWHIASLGGGEYSIRSAQSGNRALDVWNWGTENGTNIALYDYWGGDPQRYFIDSVGGGYYRITPVISTGQAVDAFGTANESNVGTWSYWGGSNQQWSIQ